MIKRQVWENKSNKQLCVTVPKVSGIKAGDIVSVEKDRVRKIVYSFVVADLFHYGHLQLLQKAASLGDLHICGVITDEGAETYRSRPITNLAERKAIISSINCVDRIMIQNGKDPTENLKKIHEEFPWAKLILVHGSDWEKVPGEEYIKEIGGEIVQPPYYGRLTTANIISSLTQLYTDYKSFERQYFKLKNTISLTTGKKKNVISTKANTLQSLQSLLKKSRVEKTIVFTVLDFDRDKDAILNKIKGEFNPAKVVVRSSAINEDTFDRSMAGYFHSELDVSTDSFKEIEKAVIKVISSYSEKGFSNPSNQVLIQKQTEDILFSGVIFTRTLEKNAPYYVINYDDKTSKTDTVTKGIENKSIYIARFYNPKDYPLKFKKVLEAVKEVEDIIPHLSLDIEFAVDNNGEIVIFQVRPMATDSSFTYDYETEIKQIVEGMKERFTKLAERKPHLAGTRTFFCDMPDWNPAEIIGNNPNYLDYSLYSYLIMDETWHKARASQGYTNVNPAKLMALFGNKPYVDVRHSFNSFTPAAVSKRVKEKLVSFYLDKLEKNPELQDKVEFEVVYTCYDLSFDKRSKELLDYGFNKLEIKELKEALLELTNNLIINAKENISRDKEDIKKLLQSRDAILTELKSEKQNPKILIKCAHKLLEDCKNLGTLQFSRLARLAFIGKIILKSMVNEGIIDEKSYHDFLNSINSVASKMSEDFSLLLQGKLNKDDFINCYGHLRPGTYDITAPRYDNNPDLISNSGSILSDVKTKFNLEIDKSVRKSISKVLEQHNLKFTSEQLFWFIRTSLEERELSKFEFSKNLSDALELIAKAGDMLGFSREDMSNLDFNSITDLENADEEHIQDIWRNLIKSRREKKLLNNMLYLPPVIFSTHDFEVAKFYYSKPNFITNKKVKAKLVNLSGINKEKISELGGNIALIENADPGYDWIFTKNIIGLITKYGGVASHMSIRCAEFGIPAAIGCGILFDSLINTDSIMLDCESKRIIPIGDEEKCGY